MLTHLTLTILVEHQIRLNKERAVSSETGEGSKITERRMKCYSHG